MSDRAIADAVTAMLHAIDAREKHFQAVVAVTGGYDIGTTDLFLSSGYAQVPYVPEAVQHAVRWLDEHVKEAKEN